MEQGAWGMEKKACQGVKNGLVYLIHEVWEPGKKQ